MQASFSTAISDERALRAALQEADIVPTLLVLVQLTGDMHILHEAAPFIKGAWSFQEEIPEKLKEKIRDRLVGALKEHAGVSPNLAPPAEDMLRQMMSVAVGQTVPSAYVPLLLEEMGLSERHSHTTAAGGEARRLPERFKVAVIGAGLAGICAAIQLE